MAGARITMTITGDGLEARASVTCGEAATPTDLAAALAAAGVSHGTDEARCLRLSEQIASPEFQASDVLIGSGTRPEAGTDGFLELCFEVGIQPGTLRSDGSIDFHDRNVLKAVAKGDMIGRYHAATQGEPGCGCDGRSIAAKPGHENLPRLGGGVVQGAGGELRATVSGVVAYQEGTLLDVIKLHAHEQDVDLHSGDLEMDGALVIKGSVTRDCRACATGDIDIKGSVDGGSVRAGGDLRVAGFVSGGERGSLVAGGSISARSTQCARLRGGDRVEVQTDSINTRIDAREIVVGRRAISGQLVAETSILVRDAGSPMGAGMVLAVGQPLDCDAAPGVITEAERARGCLKEAHGACAPDAASDGQAVRSGEPQRGRQDLLRTARIDVLGVAHPGVLVRFGDERSLLLEEEARATRFRADPKTDEILAEPLSE